MCGEWNDFVDDEHCAAWQAFFDFVIAGKQGAYKLPARQPKFCEVV
jgi:hypothetical protein